MYKDMNPPRWCHTGYFHCPKNPLRSVSYTFLSPQPQPPSTFCSLRISFSRLSYSWSSTICSLFRLTSFTCELCHVAQSCPTPCDPVFCSPSSSSVYGIIQARILEFTIPYSRGIFLTQG